MKISLYIYLKYSQFSHLKNLYFIISWHTKNYPFISKCFKKYTKNEFFENYEIQSHESQV